MTDSHVIARKFRPQTFDQVIGQQAITRTLVNSLKGNRVHHAYLFTGARGVGKTTTARIFSKALNCAKGVTPEPCGVCDSCQDIVASRSMDVLEIDAASNTGVDNVRDVIINSISIAPARDRHKIFIIDEVHMLSAQAFNALLKTVEEPPPRVVFILATTNLEKVPETILSRCQIFEFRTITLKQITAQLRSIAGTEGVQISDSALLAIARAGEGSMRDAESALDQVISFAGSTVSDEDVSAALGLVDVETLNKTLQAIADQNGEALVRIVDEVVSRGYDLRNLCREMMVHIRALLVVKIAGFDSELVQLPESEADNLKQLSEHFSEQDLLRFFSILSKTEQDMKLSSQPRFQIEMGLVKLAQARRLYLIEDAISRIEALESRLGGASAKSPASQSGSGASGGSRATRSSTNVAHAAGLRTGDRAEESQAGSVRYSPATQAPARGKSSPGKLQAATSPAETTGSPVATPAAASVAPAKPATTVDASPPTEPPPLMDEPYEAAPEPLPRTGVASRDRDPADKIKAALEAKRKNIIVAYLDKGTISIDGDYLRVSYALPDGRCKNEIETRDKRIAIEDACEQVFGRRLTLWASIEGEGEGAPKPQRKEKAKEAAADNPKLRSLVDKFHGEIVEVTKPEK